MKKLLLIVLSFNLVYAKNFQAGLSYQIPPSQKIKLRISQIPSPYPWTERDEKGHLISPKKGSIIIASSLEDTVIKDNYGEAFTLPAGSRFYGNIIDTKDSKNFWKDASVLIKFNKLEIAKTPIEFTEQDLESLEKYDGKKSKLTNKGLEIDAINFDSKQNSNLFKNIGLNFSKSAAYTLGGLISGPFITYMISANLTNPATAFATMSNPYISTSSAALGAALGLAYGIKHKGKDLDIQPGTQIDLIIQNPWTITNNLDKTPIVNKTKYANFDLRLIKTKLIHDAFGDHLLKISVQYDNKTGEELRYNSFVLVDSMGHSYYPTIESINEDLLEELPEQEQLDLCYSVEFPKTIYQLKVIKLSNHKTLALIDNIYLQK